MMKKVLFSVLFVFLSTASAAIYNCRQNSPKPSLYFDKNIQVECNFDSIGKPKLVILSGSNKVPLNQKATHIGPDLGNMYEMLMMTALDGNEFEIHAATRLFTETAEAALFTVEPNKNSGFWICRIED